MTMIKLIWITLILLSGLALGSYDIELDSSAKNISMQEFAALVPSESGELASSAIPPAVESPEEYSAVYTTQQPPEANASLLVPFDDDYAYSFYVYYNGEYVSWDGFGTLFPEDQPYMWIERQHGWSWYATMPLGAWSRMLIFVPEPAPITLYEIYPSDFVRSYYLGPVDPGFYNLWYYADTPGRHVCLLSVGEMLSNRVVIDIYHQWIPPKPSPQPTPKEICESNPQCSWYNGKCYCRGLIDDPEKQQCESNPMCHWVNGQCLCTGLIGGSAGVGTEKGADVDTETGDFVVET